VASVILFDESNELHIDSLLTNVNYKWDIDPILNTTVLTYSFPGNFQNNVSYWDSGLYSLENEYQNMQNVNNNTAEAFRSALQSWGNVANLEFVEILDTQADVGDIRLAFFNNMDEYAGAWAYSPGNFSAAGDVWLNPDHISNADGFENGSYEYQTLLHELGHALGLSHPLDDATNANYDHRFTIMSYNYHPTAAFFDGSPYYRWIFPETPMINDIAAIQYLYGANTAYHASDDLYVFDRATPFIKTIWDGGGNDTISVTNFLEGCTINLLEGSLSSITVLSDPGVWYSLEGVPNVYNGVDNLGIAFGTIIENARGGYGNDKLYGNNSNNVLSGKGGNDTLNGKIGADTMLGGAGNDTYYVDNRLDKIYETNTTLSTSGNAGGTDKVLSTISYRIASYVENLTLLGTAAITGSGNSLANILTGNVSNNTLSGEAGNDTIKGGTGNDIIYGGAGADSLYGGSSTTTGTTGGNDTFVFNTTLGASNIDTIYDFNKIYDTINFENAIFTKLTLTGTLNSAYFKANTTGKAVDSNDYIVYETDTGKLFYDTDGSGTKAAVQIALLANHPAVAYNDFVVM